ncbi:MAG: hypothetical protein ACRDHZ_01495 [Ktedonobacteraceae bacterium]
MTINPLGQVSPLPRRDSVSAQHRGLARDLLRRLEAPSAVWAHDSLGLLAPLGGPNNTSTSRRTLLDLLPERWRALASFGRLGLVISPGNPTTTIRETRAFPHRVQCPGWSDDEHSVGVLIRTVRVQLSPKPAVADTSVVTATVGLHALARRYARGCDGRDEAVLRDLLTLTNPSKWTTGVRDSNSEFDVVVPGGRWRGGAMRLDCANPVLAVRTFIASGH